MSELCVVTQRSGPLTKTYTTDRFRLVSWAGEQQCRGSPGRRRARKRTSLPG